MNTRTWLQALLDLRALDGQRVTDGKRHWDVKRDGFGAYTLRGLEKTTPCLWPDDLRHEAPAELRIAASPSPPKKKGKELALEPGKPAEKPAAAPPAPKTAPKVAKPATRKKQ